MYIMLIMLLFIVFFYFLIDKKLKLGLSNIFAMLFFTFLTCLAGLRYGVGLDYFSYEDWFKYWDMSFSSEWIYMFIMYIVKMANGEFYIITIIMAIVTNLFIYLGIKNWGVKGEYLFLSVLLYCSEHFLIYLNLMRQGAAVAIFFYASKFIVTRSFKKYLLFIILASGFHYSAIFLLVLYFLPNIRIKYKLYCTLLIVAILVTYLGITNEILNFIVKFTPYSDKYYNHVYLQSGDIDWFSPVVLFRVVFSVILIYLSSFGYDSLKKISLIITFYQIGIILNILSLSTFMFDRIGIYLRIFEIVIVPILMSLIKDKYLRQLLFIFLFVFMLIVISNSLLINPDPSLLRYKSIFESE
ncbi:hypothetical protein C3943_03755 [Lysinibacillus sp. B2A1]|nr:hypothetical protein C3943_03755 [Lysinibacillus sp. B2A1]